MRVPAVAVLSLISSHSAPLFSSLLGRIFTTANASKGRIEHLELTWILYNDGKSTKRSRNQYIDFVGDIVIYNTARQHPGWMERSSLTRFMIQYVFIRSYETCAQFSPVSVDSFGRSECAIKICQLGHHFA